jgi:hypothetical protein
VRDKSNIVIDIETIAHPVTQAEIDAAMADYDAGVVPAKAPANWKDVTKIEAYVNERRDKQASDREKFQAELVNKLSKEKAFSIGGKTMISCALGTVDSLTRTIENVSSRAGDDLHGIVAFIVNYLNEAGQYRLIGFNLQSFDLPEVCKSYQITGQRPRYRPGKWDIIDLCKHPFNKGKLKDIGKAFGFEIPAMNGGDVAALYQQGDWEAIRKYNEHDVVLTAKLFLAAEAMYSLY